MNQKIAPSKSKIAMEKRWHPLKFYLFFLTYSNIQSLDTTHRFRKSLFFDFTNVFDWTLKCSITASTRFWWKPDMILLKKTSSELQIEIPNRKYHFTTATPRANLARSEQLILVNNSCGIFCTFSCYYGLFFFYYKVYYWKITSNFVHYFTCCIRITFYFNLFQHYDM